MGKNSKQQRDVQASMHKKKKKNKKAEASHEMKHPPSSKQQNESFETYTSMPSLPASSASYSSSSVVLPFPSHLPRPPNHDFLLNQPPYRASFQTALETSYEGFVVDTKIPHVNESVIQSCLESMQHSQYFRRDVTQPFGLGTKCAKTYVTRCLVGDPGTTYKYLGLRMFAHPWKKSQNGNSSGERTHVQNTNDINTATATSSTTIQTTKTIHRLKELLSNQTKKHLKELNQRRRGRGGRPSMKGRSEYDICLINRMDPTTMDGLKPVPSTHLPQLGTSVSWHADSSLEHYSTIAVYQTLLPTAEEKLETKNVTRESNSNNDNENNNNEWYVAMRVTPHCEGPTAGTVQKRKGSIDSTIDQSVPPIAVSLPSGSTYYLLDDFNHHHQHTVLLSKNSSTMSPSSSSSVIRYSCTFRLLRDSHNVEHIIQRCRSTVSNFHKKGPKLWRSEQLLLSEIESEWIRQFYIQGLQHYNLLWETYWKQPIQQLLKYWSQLEDRTIQTYELFQHAAQGKCGTSSSSSSITILSSTTSTKSDRKLREKQKKAKTAIQGLMDRTNSGTGGTVDVKELYEGFAELLEERAKLRELWIKREKDHAFTELRPELRPLPVPFQFADSNSDNIVNKSQSTVVTSRMPGNLQTLREMAESLRSFGTAFVSGRMDDLPKEMTLLCLATKKSTGAPDAPNKENFKPSDWSGWTQPNMSFGLELQDPWASAVVDGRKEIETRSYELPVGLLGKQIWILESPSGQAGVSTMGNDIDLTQSHTNCKVLGWCRFTSVLRYTSRDSFEADESRHLVSHDSGYGWKDGKTNIIYGWLVGEYQRWDTSSSRRPPCFKSAVRRMRSLFELIPSSSTNADVGNVKRKSKSPTKDNNNNKRQKKKRRY